MNEKQFKQNFKPASCTQPPWASVIEPDRREDVLAKIKRESIAAYGYSMDECPKRKVCFTKECLGRPLPWLSETAKPYLEELQKRQTVANKELILTNCGICPMAKTCKTACAQVNDYINRDKNEEPELIYKENLDNFVSETEIVDKVASVVGKDLKIPWDVLPTKRKLTVQKYLYEQKDFLTIAQELEYHDQSRVRYEFYAALTKLSKYAVVRDFIEKHENTSKIPSGKNLEILKEMFFYNKNLAEIAKDHSISKQAVHQIISKFLENSNLKWNTFVKKEGSKIIYHVPKMMK